MPSRAPLNESQRALPTQHKTNARDGHTCPQRDSNPRDQQSSGCRTTPYSARRPQSVPHPLPRVKYTSVANISYSPTFEAITEFTLLVLVLSLFRMKHLYDCQHLVNSRTDN